MSMFTILSSLMSSFGTLLIVFFFLLLSRNKVENWMFFLHFSLVFIFIQCLYLLGNNLQLRWFPSLQYAWISKLLSLVFVLGAYFYFFPALFKNFGFNFRFDKAYLKPTLLFSLLLIFFKCITNYMDSTKEVVTLERFIYQMSLPGLEEEIVFRGLFFALFQKMLMPDATFLNKKIALGAFLVTLVFALAHSFQLNGAFRISFDPILFVSSSFAGFVYMWLRVKHDSLTPPIVCHNAVNTLITVVQWIK